MQAALQERFATCRLALHPKKTEIALRSAKLGGPRGGAGDPRPSLRGREGERPPSPCVSDRDPVRAETGTGSGSGEAASRARSRRETPESDWRSGRERVVRNPNRRI